MDFPKSLMAPENAYAVDDREAFSGRKRRCIMHGPGADV